MHTYDSPFQTEEWLVRYFTFYTQQRPHQTFGGIPLDTTDFANPLKILVAA